MVKGQKKPMLKSYLNRDERQDMIYFASLMGALEKKFIDEWCKRDNIITTDEKKYLRMVNSLLDKVMRSILKRLGHDFVKRLVSDIEDSEIFVMPKIRAKIKKEEYLKQDGVIAAPIDDIYELAGIAMMQCNNCPECKYEECKLRKYLMDIGIPALNEYASNTCQYKPSEKAKYKRVI